jgi:CRISPR/Cas system-associated endoribonuclease Cas2
MMLYDLSDPKEVRRMKNVETLEKGYVSNVQSALTMVPRYTRQCLFASHEISRRIYQLVEKPHKTVYAMKDGVIYHRDIATYSDRNGQLYVKYEEIC